MAEPLDPLVAAYLDSLAGKSPATLEGSPYYDVVGESCLGRCQANKERRAHLRAWSLGKPGDDALTVDCHRRQDVLELRFGVTSITRFPQVTRSGALRDRSFDPRSTSIVAMKGFRFLAFPRGRYRFLMYPGPKRQFTPHRFGTRASVSYPARRAGLLVKGDVVLNVN